MRSAFSKKKLKNKRRNIRKSVNKFHISPADLEVGDWDDCEDEFELDDYESEDDDYDYEFEDESDEFEDEYEDETDEYEDESDEYEDEYEDESDEYEDEYEDETDEYEDESDEYEDGYEDEADEYEDESDEYEDEYEDEADEYEDETAEYEDGEYDYDDRDGGYADDEDRWDGTPQVREERKTFFLMHMRLSDGVIAFMALLVLTLGVSAGSIYLRAKAEEKQVAAFAQIGEGVEEIEVIGESGLLAIADAQTAKLMAAELERDEQEAQEERRERERLNNRIDVVMNLTSIQKDLKIKFINKKSERLIPNVAFEVQLTSASGQTLILKDEDKDGIIYEKQMTPGKYSAVITGPSGLEEYSFSGEAVSVTVKDTIEYKKVDVADEVKTEAQVNAKVEDTKVNETVVESTNTDTVEWVESTRTLIEGTQETSEEYEVIDRSRIAEPTLKAAAGFRFLSAEVPGTLPGDAGAVSEPPAQSGADQPADPGSEATPEVTMEPTMEPTAEPTAEPTLEPTLEPTPEPAQEPTAEPTLAPTPDPIADQTPTPDAAATQTPTQDPLVTQSPAPTQLPTASPEQTPTAGPTQTPSATPTASPTQTPSASPTADPAADAKNDTTTNLLTTSGEKLYVKDEDGNFREAKYADYYNSEIKEFYIKNTKTAGQYRYTGWQTLDGATYFYDKDGNPVTGEQVIQGAKYTFNENGVLNTGSGHLGIDVSKWNGSINWGAVKDSGVSYVIIRCGYRGSTTGALIEDPMFRTNIKGAQSAGLKVGVYFFTQAVNEVEAVEEASMVLGLIKGYNISYPVFLDVEPSNGRGDAISSDARTAVCKAFCQTIQNSGYKAGIYANKNWLTEKMNAGSLTGYKIWLAQYAASPTYTATKYDLWQYSSKGSVAGISGGVDMNISYLGY